MIDHRLPPRERLRLIAERDGDECVWCRQALSERSRSREHVIPRLKGGPSWPENELAACRGCNRRRGHMSPANFVVDCERRGLTPNRALVLRALHSLDGAIARRGGSRKCRPYLAKQLRRLERAAAATA